MDNLTYLVAAYGVFWVVTFALVLSTAARQRRLDREIHRLEDLLRRRDEAPE